VFIHLFMVCLTTLSADLQLEGSEIARNVSVIGRSLLEICFQNSLIGVKKTTTSVPAVVLHRGFKTGQFIK
jgi:hypothetical protein